MLNLLKIFLIISVIMLIINGITSSLHRSKKGLVILLVSLGLMLLGFISLFIDTRLEMVYAQNPLLYYFFSGSAFVYFIYGIVLMVKGGKLPAPPKHKKMVYTYHQKDEFVYFCVRNNDEILLTEKQEPIIKKLKKKEFADEAVNEYLKGKNTLLPDRIGKLTVKGEKTDQVYYCYLIEADSKENFEGSWVSVSSLPELITSKTNKYLVFKTLLKEEFDEII